ncbi:MAG: DUF354 domain-containing protein [Deltaproteobacteria bacterium]|nr:DUF354 domain-containing protein [Deltaproteobacteria bacterium]
MEKIWIDLANSPHVLLFRPLIEILRREGHEVVVTLRDFAQTIELARKFGLDGEVVGDHGGRSRVKKAANLAERTWALQRFVRRERPTMAVSHNAYAQVLAARASRLLTVTMMDYEGQPANHLAFRLAHRVIVPASFPDEALKRFGANSARVVRYVGFKEQVYLSDFVPSSNFLDELRAAGAFAPFGESAFDPGVHPIVTVRTPATMATYHRFENPLFDRLLERLNARRDLVAIVLARTDSQREAIRRQHPNLFLPTTSLDGRELIAASDLVISAGGTMNREAAVFGTPAYTVFAGKIPAVDRALIDAGRLVPLRTVEDLDVIKFEKKPVGLALAAPKLAGEIAQAIVSSRGPPWPLRA